jgi:hypothetical protein
MLQGNNYKLKDCRRCNQNKKESQFRYIRRFKKFRRICKRCESLIRQTRKRSVERYVQEHGVTPGILERIQKETSRDAERQSRILVLNNLSRFNRIRYLVSKILLWPFCIVLYPLTIMMLLSIWAGISKGLSRDITEVSIIFAVVAGMTGFLYVPVRSTNGEISSQRVAIGGRLFREAL